MSMMRPPGQVRFIDEPKHTASGSWRRKAPCGERTRVWHYDDAGTRQLQTHARAVRQPEELQGRRVERRARLMGRGLSHHGVVEDS